MNDTQTPTAAPANGATASGSRFEKVDAYIRDHHSEFPQKPQGGVDWIKLEEQKPESFEIFRATWPITRQKMMQSLQRRFCSLVKGPAKKKSPKGTSLSEAKNPTHPLTIFMREHLDDLPKQNGIGKRIDWIAFKEKYSDIWEKQKLERRLSAKSLTDLFKYHFKKAKKAIGKTPKAAKDLPVRPQKDEREHHETHRGRTHITSVSAQAELANFRFSNCPMCLLHIGTAEAAIGIRLAECPRCKFDLASAEQGYVAKKLLSV